MLALGKLSISAADAVERHMETCRRCAQLLGESSIGEDMLEQIRDLERSQEEDASALSTLTRTEDSLSQTLFGRRKSSP
jgi:anti-sigma factor RsiW